MRRVPAGVALLVVMAMAGWLSPSAWAQNREKAWEINPYAGYMSTPVAAAVFIFVVFLAGGVREELSRAFSLHRFAQRLGGARLGLIIYSAAFGLFHLPQRIDAALIIGLLGAFWGLLYLKRRSVVASIVNHGAFDASQVLLQLLARSLSI